MAHPGRRGVGGLLALVTLGCLVAILAMLQIAIATAPVPRGGGGAAAAPGWGFTHTQYTADGSGDPGADAAARKLIARTPLAQDQAMMGWGADNPEPSPGVYDFTRLDARVAMIVHSGGQPVLTLCCAPDWMKGGTPGRTDWARLEVAPAPAHYGDFAALAATVARRYPQVHAVVVWNEFKGFFDDRADAWDAAGYTALYNDVYRALKAARPDLAVGGPYLSMDSFTAADRDHASAVNGPWGSLDQRVVTAFGYWLRHRAGADFVAVDGSSLPRDAAAQADPFAATAEFTAVSRWIHRLTPLPLWWTEWYVEPANSGWSEPQRDAVLAAGMIALAQGRVAGAFYWNPQTSTGQTSTGQPSTGQPSTGRSGVAQCPGCLWSSTGGALPPLGLLQGFARWFGPDVPLAPVQADDARVLVLAQAAEGVVVNTTGGTVSTTVDGHPMTLGPYAVTWFDRAASH